MTEDYGALAKEAREEAEAVAFDYDNSSALLFELADAIDALQAQLDGVRDALNDPYKRASLQNALNVLNRVDVAVRVEVTD